MSPSTLQVVIYPDIISKHQETSRFRWYIDSIARLSALSADLCVLIERYTDETVMQKMNMALSKDRASSVTNYLVQKPGIKRDRLVAIGKGKQFTAGCRPEQRDESSRRNQTRQE